MLVQVQTRGNRGDGPGSVAGVEGQLGDVGGGEGEGREAVVEPEEAGQAEPGSGAECPELPDSD